MKIAIDIDGVVADIVSPMQKEAAKVGATITFNQYYPVVDGTFFYSCLFIESIVTEVLFSQM